MSKVVLITNTSNDSNNNTTAADEDVAIAGFNQTLPTIYRCRAPIASLDCMEEFQSTAEQLCLQLTSGGLQGYTTPTSVSRQTSVVTPGLRYRNLGKSGLRVSSVGLGTWVTFGGNVSEEQAESVVVAAYDAGVNLFDISEAHSGTRAEIELGNILQKKNWKRHTYVVATKIYWNAKSEERGLSRKHIISSVQASLARLKLSYIDIVIVHKCDPMCPTEEIVRAMTHVISQGWVMYWGTSRWSPVEIMEAYTNCRQFNCITPIIEQTEYHIFCREKAELYLPELYNKIGVGLMAWSPISMNLISGRGEENTVGCLTKPSLKERTQVEEMQKQREKLKEISTLASRMGCSLTQLTIAWTLKHESVQCLLIGASTPQQFYHALYSLQLVPKINATIMSELDKILENKPVRPPMISTLALR
nr:PREDICTED: voltage-gated potassium channel subunit beta-2 isoform X2 [Bemisia tabaci]